MNKSFIFIVAILALFAGMAYAADLNDLLTAELAADTTGRTRVSNTSIAMQIWNTIPATTYAVGAQLGVSRQTLAYRQITFYENNAVLATGETRGMGVKDANGVIHTTTSTCDTIGAVVDYINGDTSGYWHAKVGPDAYRAMSARYLAPFAATTTVGGNEATATPVYIECSELQELTCGVAKKDNTVNRIKSITHRVSGAGNAVVTVMDGDTEIYHKEISRTSYNNGTYVGASPDTINFAAITAGKGIAGGRGKSLVVRVSATTIGADPLRDLASDNNMSITYDQVVK